MRYVWLVEGEPYIGTLSEYADDVGRAHHSDVTVGKHVWYAFGDGLRRAIPTVMHRTEHDDIETVYITVGDDEARYQIDLRT